ncbi:MAG: holo-ACP synthase [Holosporales bacterium]|jgi:holo-[acyl-carrier protein] synthase|nr:holo-ACP synthase [Holosporales bacterium]
MIIGLGIDLLDSRRIDGIMQRHGDRFQNKIYTRGEREFALDRTKPNESFAKIFSTKEAVIKAISNVSGVFWHDIEVFHDKNGKPIIKLHNMAHKNLLKKTNGAAYKIDVTVSDERHYVIAFAIVTLEKT